MDFPSVRVTTPNDLTTGVGTIAAIMDATGVVAYAPTRHMQDSAVMHQYFEKDIDLNASLVDKAIFIPSEGVWVLNKVSSIRNVVAGGAGTADIKMAPSGTAPASGTTCLATANSITLDAPAAHIILNTPLATTPVECGPGSYFALDVASTLTSLVGVITVQFKRVR